MQRSSERQLLETTIIARVNDLPQFIQDQIGMKEPIARWPFLTFNDENLVLDTRGLEPFWLPGEDDEVRVLSERYANQQPYNDLLLAINKLRSSSDRNPEPFYRNLREFAVTNPVHALESIAAIRNTLHSFRVARDGVLAYLDTIIAAAHRVKPTTTPHVASSDPQYAAKIESKINATKNKFMMNDPIPRCLQRIGELEVFMRQYFGIAETSVSSRPLSQIPPALTQMTHSQVPSTSTGIPFDAANQPQTTGGKSNGRKTRRKHR